MSRSNKPPTIVTPLPADRDSTLILKMLPGESEQRGNARAFTSPEMRAAMTLLEAGSGTNVIKLTPTETLEELIDLTKAVTGGNLSRGEATLAAQVNVLDALFHKLTRRAMANMGEHLGASETYFRLALKAQSQCRAAVETLAAVKNPPPVAFVRQANIGNAVQVNNGTPPPLREEIAEIRPNKLLGGTNGKRLDSRAPSVSGPANQDLEAVAAINRPAKRRRKVES